MKFLIFATTPNELEWAYQTATQSVQDQNEWRIVRLDRDFYVSTVSPEKPDNCEFLDLKDLPVIEEKVWSEMKQIQTEMHKHLIARLWRGVDIILKQHLDYLIFHTVYAESIIGAAIQTAQPDEILIPPPRGTNRDTSSQNSFGKFQWLKQFQGVVVRVAAESGVRCRKNRLFAAQKIVNRMKFSIGKAASLAIALLYDSIRLMRWLVSSGRKTIKSAGSIVVANYDGDLHRQFDLKKAPAELQKKLCLWLGVSERSRLLAPPWRQIDFAEHLSAGTTNKESDLRKIADAVFPSLVTPSLFEYGNRWYCQAAPKYRPSEVSARLWSILGSAETTTERLANWNRIADAVTKIFFARDLFAAVEPELVVASDVIDSNKFLAIAAHLSGVKTLTTYHAVDVSYDYITATYQLGGVDCVFGKIAPYLSEIELPEISARRLIAYDSVNLLNVPENVEPDNESARTVLLVTSIRVFCSSSLGANLFLDREKYAESLESLVRNLAAQVPKIKIIIKSHPLDDAYSLYEELKRKYPETVVRHWREPLDGDQPVPARAVVFFNSLSTLFFTLVKQNLPVVAHYGALTAVGKRLIATPELLGSDDEQIVARYVGEILDDANGSTANAARRQASQVYDKFIGKSAGGLNEAVAAALKN